MNFDVRFRIGGPDLQGQTGDFTVDRNSAAADALHDAVMNHEILPDAAVKRGRAIAKTKNSVDLQHLIAGILWHNGLRDEAAKIWEKTLAALLALIPADFEGEMSWHNHENRPFLRVAHSTLLARMHFGDGAGSADLVRKLLTWCPDDNLGIRFLKGDVEMMCGRPRAALESYLQWAHEVPALWYQAGRVAFLQENFTEACTYLRRGVAGNPYIAEALGGRTALANHMAWHTSNRHDVSAAATFLEGLASAWGPQERDFLDWLFNSTEGLLERAEGTRHREALAYEHNHAVRGRLVSEQRAFEATIDDASSRRRLVRVKNAWGVEYWPWDREGGKRQPMCTS